MSIVVRSVYLAPMAANCYVLLDEESGDAAVCDVGVYSRRLGEALEEMGIKALRYILLTHGHFDHISGVKKLKEAFGGEIVIHRLDAPCLRDSEKNLSGFFGAVSESIEADICAENGDTLFLGKSPVRVLHTPGHTVGSVCYIFDDIILSGDTLFNMSVGRMDFPGGSAEAMKRSMKLLSDLPGDYKVYPGHEEETTLQFERENNPYMKGL